MSTTYDSGVTASEVRVALNGISASAIGTDTITQKIDEAEIIVETRADSQATDGQMKMAVRTLAAKRAFMSEPPEELIQELDVREEFDIGAFVDELESDAEAALALIENPETGTRRPSPGFEAY